MAHPGTQRLLPHRGHLIMEQEYFFSGYCRCLDAARTVCVVAEDGQCTEIDCNYPDCPYIPNCKIAQQISEISSSTL